MRIYQLNTTLGFNAPGRLVRTLGRGAGEAGHVVRTGFQIGTPLPDESVRRAGGRRERIAHALRTRLTDAHGHGSRRVTEALIADMERFEPDVVHLHNLHGYWVNVPRLMGWLARSGVRVVWTLHDFWPLTGHCAFPQQHGCDRWLAGCHDCPARGDYPASWWRDRSRVNFVERREWLGALRDVRLVAVSRWQKAEIERALGAGGRCEVVYNPVEMPRPTASVRRDRLRVLGAASVWDDRKGLDRFIELRRHLPERYEIVLAGVTRGLSKGVTGIPRLRSAQAMADFYGSGGVFVNLSRAETLGMVNLEARACGTPVVTMAAGGLAETVTGQSGFLLEEFDPELAARRIVEMIHMADNEAIAREVATDFPTEAAVARYLGIYS